MIPLVADEDGLLLQQVAAGDRDAFHLMYKQLAPHVLGLATALLPDVGDAEDATIQVMTDLWRIAPRLTEPASTWTLAATLHYCARHSYRPVTIGAGADAQRDTPG